jgi:hypothetical protein
MGDECGALRIGGRVWQPRRVRAANCSPAGTLERNGVAQNPTDDTGVVRACQVLMAPLQLHGDGAGRRQAMASSLAMGSH